MILNRRCEYAGEVLPFIWDTVDVQAACSVEHVIAFLDALRRHGLYDASLIILHADHGYWKLPGSKSHVGLRNLEVADDTLGLSGEDFAQIVSASAPLLAIKPPHSSGPLSISSAPAALTDIPATLSALLALDEPFGGKSVFTIGPGESRTRRFFYYHDLNREGDDFFDQLEEYAVRGPLRDRASWRLVTTRPGRAAAQQIQFGTDRTLRILRGGWSAHEAEPGEQGRRFNWAVGRSASLTASLPRHAVTLHARVKAPFGSGEQRVTVTVDGKVAGTWRSSQAWNWEDHVLAIDADENRPAASVIQFAFSDCLEPTGLDSRCLALAFESITLDGTAN
jgi:hypothetical protein